MRIRVLAEPQSGIPQVKSWFNIERECTVASLKSNLCASISALRDARVQAIELVLLLDDFELLDNTAVHILRDGDLVWYVEQHTCLVTYRPDRSLRRRTHPTKRKAAAAVDAPRKRHRQSLDVKGHATKYGPGGNTLPPYVRKETNDSSSSCSSSSSSSTTSDDSSSNSESTSDSGSDSSSTSSSSDDDSPALRPLPVKKESKPTYVAFIFRCWKTGLQLASYPQARTCPSWIWEAGDACTQRAPSEKAYPRARNQSHSSSPRG
jgi:hypothetical protein